MEVHYCDCINLHACVVLQTSRSQDMSEDEGNPPSVEENPPAKEGEPPDGAFLMITQHCWENDVLWDVPYTPSPAFTGAGESMFLCAPVYTALLHRSSIL